MVWQVLEGLSRDSAKRLRFVPGVVYVDEGAACGQSPEDRARTLAEVALVLQAVRFPWHVVALEEVFGLPPSVLRCSAREPTGPEGAYKAAVDSFLQQQHALGARGEEPRSQARPRDPQSPAEPPAAAQTEALSRLFSSVKTLTAKQELLQTLRTHLILHVARTHGYSKVMTGDSCTRLAVKLMTSLALGRGAFLAWDTGFSDERHGDVVVVRPMREHTLKEVAFYNRLFAVPSVFTPAVDTKAPEKASVHRLMEAFILRLQAQFPSTDKREAGQGPQGELGRWPPRPPLPALSVRAGRRHGWSVPACVGCGGESPGERALGFSGPRGPLSSSLLADSATAFGAQTSSRLPQTQPRVVQAGAPCVSCCCTGMGGARGCCAREDPRAQVVEQLCYGCRVNMKDLPSLEPLPPYILAEAQLRSQRAEARQEIQERPQEDSADDAPAGES
ncbi:cytoplasmic tRNA 2-thiolation protein 2 isoform X5 [Hippopotamus amphibius kiboko]|nr:cytoplasmic tRNA 2-thiolation protein 2 isoform X5 [Hippopotamus amphibius kiboko]